MKSTSSRLPCTSTARRGSHGRATNLLGNGLILTAAHVPGNVAETKPHVVIAGEDLPASLVRQGELEGVDLTLLSIDVAKVPVDMRMRRMPLCERAPYGGESVVVATPEGTARSSVLPRQAIPAELRGRFDTAIGDVATTGNSGSGVFDATKQCLLGIISRKISIVQQELILGAPVRTTKDIAKYFVPALPSKPSSQRASRSKALSGINCIDERSD